MDLVAQRYNMDYDGYNLQVYALIVVCVKPRL